MEPIDRDLVARLIRALRTEPVPPGLASEADFERHFVEPVCRKTLAPMLKLYVHPWGDGAKKKDWHDSKEWGAVHAWGTVQAFDLLARDERHAATESPGSKQPRLAVEVKLANIHRGRFPTGELQRMLGQCLLARLVHDVVIGVFGYVGDPMSRASDENLLYEPRLAEEHGVWLVMKKIG